MSSAGDANRPAPVSGRMLVRSYLKRNTALSVSFIAALGVFAVGLLAVDGFASGGSLDNMLALTAILAIVAYGQTLVIIGGGIDLSVPWVMTGSGIITAYLSGANDGTLLWVVPLVLALAAGVGVVNGLGVTVLGVPPIVMTLATNVALSGAVILFALGRPAQGRTPPLLQSLISDDVLGVPVYLLVMAVTVLLFSALLSFTSFGRRLYAVGSSAAVSRLSGIDVRRITILSYVASAIGGAIAGMLLLGYLRNAYFGMGEPYLFTAISAVVVGGASILGGSGHVLGTLGGALLLTVSSSLLAVLELGAGAISIFYGVIILGSVIALSDPVRARLHRRRLNADEGAPYPGPGTGGHGEQPTPA